MQDEITDARRKKRRKYKLKRLLRFTFALALVLIAVILVNTVTVTTFNDIKDGLTTFFTFSGGYPAELGKSSPTQVAQMSRAYAVVTENEFIIKSQSGKNLFYENHGFVSPYIAASGNRAVLYNRESKDVRVYNRTGPVAELKTDFSIVDLDISSNGVLGVLTQSDRYMSELAIYQNGKYEKVMTWKGAAGFPISTSMSDNGSSAAVASVIARNGKIYTTITSIDVARQSQRYETEISGLCVKLICENDGSVTMITDESAVRVVTDGTVKNTYTFGDVPLLFFAKDKGNKIALGFGDNSRPAINSVLILNSNLEVTVTIENCGIIKDIYLSSNRLYILGNKFVTAYSMAGEAVKTYDADPRALNLVEFSSIMEILPDRVQKLDEHKSEENNDVADT
ncbi:MAG: DUF5711 family protein [Oscillospiraceae bacterium]